MEKKNHKIDNLFFDLISFLISFFLGFFRGFKMLFLKKERKKVYKNYFYDFINFIFRLWPKYFWKKPSFYKVISFFGDLLEYTFLSKPQK